MKKLLWLWLAATLAVLAWGFHVAMFVVPADFDQGNIQRIFYYHLPSAILGLIFPYLNFAASLAYLGLRRNNPIASLRADAFALATAEITIVFTSIGLLTGILWARPVWGIWWAWDARLTSFLLLWLLYVSYLMVRRFSATGQTHTLAAVISVFAAIDVPIVFMSIRWWRTQHPSPVFGGGNGSGLDPSMYPAVWWNLAGWAMWSVFLLAARYQLERKRQQLAIHTAMNAVEVGLEGNA
jgi:heme exporter protein C